jgi:hypothetical protein
MSINKVYLEGKTKKQRPLGVWVLTIFSLMYGGLYQLLSTGALNVLQGYTALYSKQEVPIYFIYAFLNISIIITSMLTWGGLEFGRKSFLVFITLNFLGDGIENFGWFTRMPDSDNVRMWIRYITDIVFPLLCIWYFNIPSVKEFFKKENTTSIANQYGSEK